jgi:hypothetical protein
VKPHILVLNKKDLSDLQLKSEVEAVLRKDGINHIFFTNCKDSKCPGVKQVGTRGNGNICRYRSSGILTNISEELTTSTIRVKTVSFSKM